MSTDYSHEVFISFSFRDRETVDKIVNQLINVYKIPCWICTEAIKAGENFRTDIVEAIEAAKIVVFVQSKTSAISQEVSDEVLYALSIGKTVMPFKIEESVLLPAMRMKFHSTHFIDATKPTLDERIKELAKDICRSLGRDFVQGEASATGEGEAKLLSTPSVIPKRVFCGREDILEEIDRSFREGERVLFLNGIGGIGKTQIAKQYAKQYKQNYDTIVYATYNGSLQDMIISETAFCIEPEMIRYTLSDGTREDDDAFFKRKLDKIKRFSDERTLIIIDNFDVESDENLAQLTEGRYHLLVTTRCDYSRYYPTIKVAAVDSIESLTEIFMQNYQGYDVDADSPALVELIELVNRHTYTIELIAQHMECSGQTAEEMIDALKKEGILSLNEEVRNADMKTQIAYENLLKMFRIFSLDDAERQVLMYLSLMPIDGVNIRDFKTWAALSSTAIIRRLEEKSWIIKNTDGIALHPIIRQVVRHEIPADENNCLDFLNRFTDTIAERYTWHAKKADKDRYALAAKNLLEVFGTINDNTEALYYSTESLLSFAVDPERAVELAKRLVDYCEQKYGKVSIQAGRAVFKLGWAYAYNSQLPDSLKQASIWLTKGNDILQSVELTTSDQIAMLTQDKVNLSKIHINMYEQSKDEADYRLSVQHAQDAIDIAVTYLAPGDHQYSKVAGSYWQLSDALYTGGKYDEALSHIDKALDILHDMYGENDSDSMYALYRKAAIIYMMGRYGEARELAQKSAAGYTEFFGSLTPNVYKIYALLGDCCSKLGDVDGAMEAYTEAKRIAETIYAPGAQQIVITNKKIEELNR